MLKNRKKAQGSGAAAAVLVAVIAGLIVLYILVMPPEERENLLRGEKDEAKISEKNISLLLDEKPQRILPPTQMKFEKSLNSFELFVGEEGVELKRVDNLYVSRSLFKEQKSEFTFDIVDLANTKDVQLNFVIKKSKGRLIVKLNTHEVFNSEISTANIEPLKLKDYLVQGKNTIEFSVSSPGAVFWRTNEYSLDDITITATMIRRETQESRQKFLVDKEQKDSMKTVKLSLYPECNKAKVGKLKILVNGYELYSAIPDCGSAMKPLEFSPDKLVPGENEIIFSTDKGQYFVDNVKLTSEMKKVYLPVYYFELSEEQYKNAADGKINITLYMKFPDDVEQKEADIYVNNHIIRLDQYEIDFEKNINSYVTKGNNAVKISPDKVIDVVELKVKISSS